MTDRELEIVAYLGPRSSYSHQAALDCFDPQKFIFQPQITIADIFHAVQNRSCTYGVVPFENSTNGSVVFTLDLLRDRESQFPDALACGETYLNVHHCLLGHPRPDLSSVSRIYSHPQAFGQCEKFLATHLKGVERVDVSSTSKAAELASGDPSSVAIASKVASEVHRIQVLAANIEDSPDNTTRFLVLSSTVTSSPSAGLGEQDKTLLSFTIDHMQPGALCDSLKVFKDFNLNLTSINSRPSRVRPWNYIFFVEFVGHRDDNNVKKALKKLEEFCLSLRVLGSYQVRQKRLRA
ncbi:Prephenate dehydratase-domain-containing protein [Kalaharituber pfeilii]|nr:Prephenate dehydratase-domain-containing protein [Kalaharituber pfeilii]